MIQDTIAAIATPMGEGGIAVIRVSGDQAVRISERIFKGKKRSLAKYLRIRYITVILWTRTPGQERRKRW